jgi:cell division protein FtsN
MKNLLLFILIINLSACNYFYNDYQDQTYIRIVDSKGKPKKLKTFTPELNIRYLAEQEIQIPKIAPKIQDTSLIISEPKNADIVDNLTSEEDLSNSKEKIGNISQKTPNNNKQTDQIRKEAEIIYDPKNTPTIKKLPKKTNKKIKKGDLLIQLASFNNKNKAIKAQKKSNIKNSKILSVKIGSKTYHKLVIGPFKNKSEGKKKLNNLKKSDYKDAFFYKFK